MKRRIRMGMVGGGPGAFIGPVHRLAAEMDREIELVAGAFSSDAARSIAGGAAYGIGPDRSYPSLDAMLVAERDRADGIEMVVIATPNRHHLTAARAALEAGIAVMCDKPLTATLEEARTLEGVVARAGLPFGVTYTYAGYPLVREAKARIAAGALGTIRKLVVEYPQGWLAGEAVGKQAAWRVDPASAGIGGCIADIGVHAFHLAEFVSGLKLVKLLADLGSVVPGRALDDDCQILLRFDNGARGVLLASQISVGERNGLRLRIYGDKAGLDWRQEEPNSLWLSHADGRSELIRAGDPGLSPAALQASRTPGGHPEGYLEAFANLYRDFARLLRGEAAPLLPGLADGLRGMAFIDTAVRASRENAGWVDFTG
ncbi:Gfo/Idh/MocA family oxidoreductase [Niveispirillum sp. BGYR6]|uniref:Gfo/Idh/MocA family protein n=1 Tax=Niveispirillum sp. BGYR6 TaxID=2971249 RepID=UPI0022B99F2B|nr:Gfo/Idh/MocA family oxidoreductase [Niveispirillum sp. BGYR6]MDG5497216.1 Gfo/Idh/MocA family oxidoreductase [Niveispirillum sp. BGYR6]